MLTQLGSITGTVSRGRIKIELKHDVRKLPSPDRADTVAMAFFRRAQGGPAIDVGSHAGEEITAVLMTKAWHTSG